MSTLKTPNILLEGSAGKLAINSKDKIARQLGMLFEGECTELGPIRAAKKYGYSKQRYFQILHAFKQGGTDAIMPKKTGPKKNFVRTENVVTQIIRHRFLNPDAQAEVIAQKMRQSGIQVSTRSVERTITEHGLQKKTLPVSTQRRGTTD